MIAANAAQVNENPLPVVPVYPRASSNGGDAPSEILSAVARGWDVFPLAAGTKDGHLLKSWKSEACSDFAQVNAWARQWPGCNWALATGARSGVFVLDADSENAFMWTFTKELPTSYLVKTGRAKVGFQFYFRQPAGIRVKNSQKELHAGVDIRGDGGYVVLPPSLHPSGNRYEIFGEGELSDAPDWLLDLVKDTREDQATALPSDLEQLHPHQKQFGQNIFLKACREFAALPIGTGVRNAAMNKLGFLTGRLLTRDCFDLEFAEGAVREYAGDYLLAEGERAAMRTFKSGLTAGSGHPWEPNRDAPEDAGFGQAPLPPGASLFPVVAAAQGARGPIARGGDGLLNLEQQKSHFAGCVYIQSQHRVLVPGGDILKPEVFKVEYGGFIFTLDSRNDKTTRDPFEAFTQSQGNDPERAFGACFKPQLPFGATITRNGQRFVNTYFPVDVERKQGDPGPFHDFLCKLLPDQRDRDILLAYMAACVQHVGIKFHWAPLIQGVEGNGKTLLSRCVEQAVGERYTHWPKAKELGNKFNDWMMGKLFFPVEDIYVPDSKAEIMEDLKPMITGGRFEIQKKGIDQFTAEVCGNFMFNSNHRDAIRITDDSRRFCILFTAQQSVEDLKRDGMDGDYFPGLYKWLRDGGYAIVSELLHTYAIPAEFNPAGDCQRAPTTSTSHEAVAASRGGVEQEIEEALEQEVQGFCGGWISDHFVKLLPRAAKLTPRKRHEILEQMGYVLHPHLKGGWTNNVVIPDGRRSKLYIRSTSVMLSQISSPPAIAKNYEDANKIAVNLPFTLAFTKNS